MANSKTVSANCVPWERIDKNNCVLVILDLQVGLFGLARDWDAGLFDRAIMNHAAIGKLFNLPVVMTTSAQTSPNGPLPKEFLEMYPDAPLIQREGEVSAWDNPAVRKAIEDTGKKQVIIAGIATDVCTTFFALALREKGYTVFANVEASGCTTELIRDTSNDRMRQAGVYVVSVFYIIADLMRDWRASPGSKEIFPFFIKNFPAFSYVARAHAAAVTSGVIAPGEEDAI